MCVLPSSIKRYECRSQGFVSKKLHMHEIQQRATREYEKFRLKLFQDRYNNSEINS
jgi:hypothetical protein